jgi:hypothetical protein
MELILRWLLAPWMADILLLLRFAAYLSVYCWLLDLYFLGSSFSVKVTFMLIDFCSTRCSSSSLKRWTLELKLLVILSFLSVYSDFE